MVQNYMIAENMPIRFYGGDVGQISTQTEHNVKVWGSASTQLDALVDAIFMRSRGYQGLNEDFRFFILAQFIEVSAGHGAGWIPWSATVVVC